MKALIADKMPDTCLDNIRELGIDLEFNPKMTEDDLGKGIPGHSILVVRSTVVNRSCIESSPELSLIIRAGAGVNNIDVKAANENGVYVANCPGKNSVAVAELAMGMILALDRSIPDNVSDFRNGKWNKALYSKSEGLLGKKLGIIGMGQIGEELATRARAFGMDICAWSRSLTPERAGEMDIDYMASPLDVVSEADIISVHLALKPETRGIISAELFAAMKPGTMFVNTARAEVVDEDAMIDHLRSGKIRAAVDVFSGEPEQKEGPFDNRLRDVPNLYVTHHIGASTMQAQNAVAAAVVDIIRTFIKTGKVNNWLNRSESTAAPWQLIVRHYDKPGVIAGIMNELKGSEINAEELENVIFDGQITACCSIRLSDKPSGRIMENIRGMKGMVISATLLQVM
ncbi:MAG: phosphoglycerate dehydrogenase [Balneolaceae bacterium]|nr:MAG: phosphoglycerate dehydrogenase [Balneolaceae bacterium]